MRVDTTARAFVRSKLKAFEIEIRANLALTGKKLKIKDLQRSPLKAVEIYEMSLKGLG